MPPNNGYIHQPHNEQQIDLIAQPAVNNDAAVAAAGAAANPNAAGRVDELPEVAGVDQVAAVVDEIAAEFAPGEHQYPEIDVPMPLRRYPELPHVPHLPYVPRAPRVPRVPGAARHPLPLPVSRHLRALPVPVQMQPQPPHEPQQSDRPQPLAPPPPRQPYRNEPLLRDLLHLPPFNVEPAPAGMYGPALRVFYAAQQRRRTRNADPLVSSSSDAQPPTSNVNRWGSLVCTVHAARPAAANPVSSTGILDTESAPSAHDEVSSSLTVPLTEQQMADEVTGASGSGATRVLRAEQVSEAIADVLHECPDAFVTIRHLLASRAADAVASAEQEMAASAEAEGAAGAEADAVARAGEREEELEENDENDDGLIIDDEDTESEHETDERWYYNNVWFRL